MLGEVDQRHRALLDNASRERKLPGRLRDDALETDLYRHDWQLLGKRGASQRVGARQRVTTLTSTDTSALLCTLTVSCRSSASTRARASALP